MHGFRLSWNAVKLRHGLGEQSCQYQQRGTTDHADICHVKCWPVPVCQVEVEKIGHGSVTNAVQGIAKSSSRDESQACSDKAVVRPQQPNDERRRNGSR